MKKIFYLFLLPILLVGCSKETEKLSEPSPVGGMISVHSQREFSDGPLSASAIHSDVFTRVAGDAVLAYTFEAWTRDANPRCVLHKTVTGTLTEAVFEIALIPGNYDFLFWADFSRVIVIPPSFCWPFLTIRFTADIIRRDSLYVR